MSSRYFNDAGEPLMTASQARFEAYLDADADAGDPQEDAERYAAYPDHRKTGECKACEGATEADFAFCPYCGDEL